MLENPLRSLCWPALSTPIGRRRASRAGRGLPCRVATSSSGSCARYSPYMLRGALAASQPYRLRRRWGEVTAGTRSDEQHGRAEGALPNVGCVIKGLQIVLISPRPMSTRPRRGVCRMAHTVGWTARSRIRHVVGHGKLFECTAGYHCLISHSGEFPCREEAVAITRPARAPSAVSAVETGGLHRAVARSAVRCERNRRASRLDMGNSSLRHKIPYRRASSAPLRPFDARRRFCIKARRPLDRIAVILALPAL